MSVSCPKCGGSAEQISGNRYECPYCGESFTVAPTMNAPAPGYGQYQPAAYQNEGPRPQQPQPQAPAYQAQANDPAKAIQTGSRNKYVAVALAFFLGAFGAQRMYLGSWGIGILCLLFCWTYLPCILALVDIIILLTMSDEAFNAKYNTRH